VWLWEAVVHFILITTTQQQQQQQQQQWQQRQQRCQPRNPKASTVHMGDCNIWLMIINVCD
jgi:hypothetical protein